MMMEGRRPATGQALVLVALSFTVMLLMAAVAIEAGRFVSERRFLQNAVDSATLAGAYEWREALIRQESEAQAETSAKQRALEAVRSHFAADPTGTPPSDPADPPIFDPSCGTAPVCLMDGILVNSPGEPGAVRVAIRNDIDYTFGRLAGLTVATIGAKAHAGPDPNAGGPLPIAVRQFISPLEPGGTNPCPPYDPIPHPPFTAVFATDWTACVGDTNSEAGRVAASFENPGPVVEILGQGADASSGGSGGPAVSFRGFVALDIRNFSTPFSRTFHNGVTSGTNANTLKEMQSRYICSGYPGPPFPSVVSSPPDPELQVAIMDGTSANQSVGSLKSCYTEGDLIMVLVYDGIVKRLPEFEMEWPGSNSLGQIDIPTTPGTVVNAGYFNVSRNAAFSGTVTLVTIPDPRDDDNPLNNGGITSTPQITYVDNPTTPSLGGGRRVDIRDITVSEIGDPPENLTPGIHAALVRGTGNAYADQHRYLPLSMNVGNVQRDFVLSGPTPGGCAIAATGGDPVTCSFSVSNANNNPSRRFNSTVSLTLEDLDGNVIGGGPFATGVSMGQSRPVTISTPSAQGLYLYVIRATGINADGDPVTHLLPFIVNVAPSTSPGNDTYVDITGYALMEIVCSPSHTQCMPPNEVWAKALTSVIPDMNDPAFLAVTPIRLIPWDY